MKQIPLSQGKSALVDDEDYKYLMQWKWHFSNGYAIRSAQTPRPRKHIYMHRVVAKTPDELEVDHINHNRVDNRKENLRNCTRRQNQHNQSVQKRKIFSQFKGVTKYRSKWVTRISINRIPIHIGYFENERHAAMAYDIWAKDLFGEYATLNFS